MIELVEQPNIYGLTDRGYDLIDGLIPIRFVITPRKYMDLNEYVKGVGWTRYNKAVYQLVLALVIALAVSHYITRWVYGYNVNDLRRNQSFRVEEYNRTKGFWGH